MFDEDFDFQWTLKKQSNLKDQPAELYKTLQKFMFVLKLNTSNTRTNLSSDNLQVIYRAKRQ